MIQRVMWTGLYVPLLALILALAPARDGSAAQWGMYQHDAQHTGKGTGVGPSSVVSPKWSSVPARFIAGTAVGDDGTVYGADVNGRAYALNPDGSVKYTLDGIGVCCSPPVIGPDGTIYFSGFALFALNPDFTVKWVYGPGGTCCGSMVIGPDGTIYVANGALHAVRPDGTAKWVFRPSDGAPVPAAPSLSRDGAYVYVATERTLYALESVTSVGWWQVPVVNLAGTAPVVGPDGIIYIPSISSVLALNPDGSLFREIPLPADKQVTNMAFDAGNQGGTLICLVYGFSINTSGTFPPTIWTADGELYAIDPVASAVRWTQSISGGMDLVMDLMPYAKPIIDARGAIYLATGVYSATGIEVGVHFYGFTAFGSQMFDHYTPAMLPSGPLPPSDTRLPTMDNSGTIYLLLDGAVQAFGTVDTMPPMLYGLYNLTVEATSPQGAAAYFNVVAMDEVDPSPVLACSHWPGTVFPVGTTLVTCWAYDASNNGTSGSFLVIVNDTTPPVMTVPANTSVEATGPMTQVAIGTATAYDQVGPVTITSNAPTSFQVGTTAVTWTARDGAGNVSQSYQFVTVVDTTPPALAGLANKTVEATSPQGATVGFNVTATDVVDGSPVVACSPASGSIFPVGATSVTCTASDARSNRATGSFTITVRDTTPPVMTLPPNKSVEATGPLTQVAIGTATATDLVGPLTITGNAPASFPVGTTTVTWTARDGAGNVSQANQVITVVDSTPPLLSGLFSQTVDSTSAQGAAVNFSVTATDLVDLTQVVSCDKASGSIFPIGTTTVACTARDAHNNPASGSFTVTVLDKTAPTMGTTSPLNGTTVQIPTAITVTFDEQVQSGPNFSGIVLKKGKNSVTATVTMSGNLVTITPVSPLNKGTIYTVTMPAGAVKDTAGNPSATATNFGFTTVK
ncbi:MAG TPA: HYR domain-containing protein [Geobacteraceae bacterium]